MSTITTPYPTLAPWNDIKGKSLDFAAFAENSYALVTRQKHGDPDHVTLFLTPTNNIIFNGQLFGSALNFSSAYQSDDVTNVFNYISTLNSYTAYNYHFMTWEGEEGTKSASNLTAIQSCGPNSKITLGLFGGNNPRLNYYFYNRVEGKEYHTSGVFGGDRLKWDSKNNKYLINQFGIYSVEAANTEPIPTASTTNDGLMSKDIYKSISNMVTPYYFSDSYLWKQQTYGGKVNRTGTLVDFYQSCLNIFSAVKAGKPLIAYNNQAGKAYIYISNAYYGTFEGFTGVHLRYSYNNYDYKSYILLSTELSAPSTFSYSLYSYASPKNFQLITDSNQGTFINTSLS